ncbi:hypothetical protein HBA54_00460 [Pelagibius litoralis]|uniref:Uncharacterized protein n=2 Tax=Pelagibius litoralis TaxID=374515 RepID=A0A967C1U1_9PROT|nr:hypothetical protein [Pelagibius litoralis]
MSPTVQALEHGRRRNRPTVTQLAWLRRGLDQAGGKLPLFDHFGQKYDSRTIRCAIDQGWAEPWFDNPTKPEWMVCRLTEAGRKMASADAGCSRAEARELVEDLFT